MAVIRFRRRRTAASPPAFAEHTPYCDRLILAEQFAEDGETRPNAEDRRTDHKPIGNCVEVLDEVLRPPRPTHSRR
jgi:hypothetical protein